MTKLDNADFCEFAHNNTLKICDSLGVVAEYPEITEEDGYTKMGQDVFNILHESIENFVDENSDEDIEMLARENKAMAEYLENVCNLSQEDITNIANGAI